MRPLSFTPEAETYRCLLEILPNTQVFQKPTVPKLNSTNQPTTNSPSCQRLIKKQKDKNNIFFTTNT